MKRYYLLTILLLVLLAAVVYVGLMGWDILPGHSLGVLWAGTTVALLVIANELRRPYFEEYNRKKALYPRIPDKFLADNPMSGSVIFGKDYRTGKTVFAEPGHHSMIVGSTGSGKTATCAIPTILTHDGGSLFVMDIKSRELTFKTADIHDPKTVLVDLDHQAPYAYGWDILYGLKRDGTDTEQDVLKVIREIAGIIIPNSTSGDQFWNDSAKALFTGLSIFEIVYRHNYEFVNVVRSMMNIPLRDHLDMALNTVQRDSLVASYLTSLASTADETLFSCDISMCQHLYFFVSESAEYTLRDNVHRANPKMLNMDGTYADAEYHHGYIYQACNFTYHGLTAKKTDAWLKQPDGTFKKCGRGRPRGENVIVEWRPRSRKHRYLMVYDKKLKTLWPKRICSYRLQER